ncbi:MAG: branched chain amino acid aminotransferase [Bacteroidetes bacterium GWF2_33_16]|nr:MAG: branched chain amino acid aminotransferase [Bacteroidetes bacterium GWE2_32_14]OFY04882.1 MAG: branched chain amino acid aminotransferase [Bacteroidetes bacterium GWF2_33_16]
MQNLEWSKLPFGYLKTDYNVRCYNRDGKWGELEISSSEYINLHIASTAIHYGQQAFEGMKAYMGKDGNIRIFRWEENFKRLERSANGILMQPVTKELFKKAITTAVLMNKRFMPPYGTGATLYIRPLLIGSGAEVGVKPAGEYLFAVFVSPVGPYFKEGFNPVKIAVVRDSDRAAPLGTGSIKVGGNYASSLKGVIKARDAGYSSPMYLDSVEKKYIDEIGAANFFGIKDNTYITPKSTSILPSITNMSLMQLAEEMGLKVERRPVAVEELESFEEVGACGTAAIISPIGEIFDIDVDKKYTFCKDGKAGPISTKLYNKLVGIQFGDEPDTHGWVEILK